MASSYTPLGVELMVTGENAGTWGTKTNNNLSLIEQLTSGYSALSIAGGAGTQALDIDDGALTGTGQFRMIEFTGTISGNRIITIPNDVETFYMLRNTTSGAHEVEFEYISGSGTSVTFASTDKGDKLVFACADDGTNPNIKDLSIGTTSPAGTTGQVQINSSGSFGAVAEGTSGFVLTSNGSAAAPTMQAPAVSVGKAIAMAIVFG
jgi:hypothetical protein